MRISGSGGEDDEADGQKYEENKSRKIKRRGWKRITVPLQASPGGATEEELGRRK